MSGFFVEIDFGIFNGVKRYNHLQIFVINCLWRLATS